MTREKFWEIVTTKLVWVDYWSGQEEPSDEVKEILTNSLLIPKPKFKKGDQVYITADADPYGPEVFKIEKPLYSIEDGIYSYTLEECDFRVDEEDLDYYIEEKEEEELPE